MGVVVGAGGVFVVGHGVVGVTVVKQHNGIVVVVVVVLKHGLKMPAAARIKQLESAKAIQRPLGAEIKWKNRICYNF